MLPRGQIILRSAPTRHASPTTRARAASPRALAIRPSQGASKPASTPRFKPFRTDPLNHEPTANRTPNAPFKPSRTDPLNREPATKPAQLRRSNHPARIP